MQEGSVSDPTLITYGDESRVVIPHNDPDYTPWRVDAVQPKGLRDAIRVLLGRYKPRVRLTRSLTVLGMSKQIKRVYIAPIREMLDSESPLSKLSDRR